MKEGRKLENFKGKSLKASLDVDLLKTEWEKQHMNTCLCLYIPSDRAVTAAAQPLGTQGQCNVLWPGSTQLCCDPVHTDEVGLFILGRVSLTQCCCCFHPDLQWDFPGLYCAGSHRHNTAVFRSAVGFSFALQENLPAQQAQYAFMIKNFMVVAKSDFPKFPNSVLLN